MPTSRPSHRLRRIKLALQGGGHHGAFTWGVLDRLLEEESIAIEGISGTSAGAMNAAVLAHGLAVGGAARGRQEARAALLRFWTRVAKATLPAAPAAGPLGLLFGPLAQPLQQFATGALTLDWMSRLLSPYQFNPLDINPLRDIVQSEVDFERVRAYAPLHLFVAATNLRTGLMREFRRHELSAEVIMASACLPMLFRAVEIDGEAYWDGGYVGNPSLLPLIRECPAPDMVLVQINPARIDRVPRGADEIVQRLDEITFNASLLKELRAIALLKQALADEGRPAADWRAPLVREVAGLRLHRIGADGELQRAGADAITGSAYFTTLHRIGREVTGRWLEHGYPQLGRRSTLDLSKMNLFDTPPQGGNGRGRQQAPAQPGSARGNGQRRRNGNPSLPSLRRAR